MSTDSLSVPKPFYLSNLERRELARAEMASYADSGLFRYLLHSPYIRHVIRPTGLMLHAIQDVIVITSDSDNDPAAYWRDLKKRLKRDDPLLCENFAELRLPSWINGKFYKTDMVDTGWLFFLLIGIREEVSNRIRSAFAEDLNKVDRKYHAAIIAELERETGWAGTRNRLLMAGIYQDGDYENPRQPPGNPPEVPTLWRPKR